MTDTAPIILWFRRDLRLTDHPALFAACETGRPVIPIFIHDEGVQALGAAPAFRLELGLKALAAKLEARGSRLILRRGPAAEVIDAVIAETGARSVWWTRAYDPAATARDSAIKALLKARRIDARSFGGHLLIEPWTVETRTGGFYRVYTPFWKSVRDRDMDTPRGAPARLAVPDSWPRCDTLDVWKLSARMSRGAAIVGPWQDPGEDAAQDRLARFIDTRIADYDAMRDKPAVDGTSGLSAHLSLGEISPHQCWQAAQIAMADGKPGAETFLKELIWREFAYHLMHHTPHLLSANWKPDWDRFPWNKDRTHRHVIAWQRGRTGVRFVDAAMREMYVTGRMHNRGRMIVASYLTKHLMCHWQIGLDWFADCLTDWDPASNAMGWQWAAGSGPDAAPYFRVFNPVTQLDKFDPTHAYARRWIAEGQAAPPDTALSYFDAIPARWNLRPTCGYPAPVVDAAAGRKAALSAYEARDF